MCPLKLSRVPSHRPPLGCHELPWKIFYCIFELEMFDSKNCYWEVFCRKFLSEKFSKFSSAKIFIRKSLLEILHLKIFHQEKILVENFLFDNFLVEKFFGKFLKLGNPSVSGLGTLTRPGFQQPENLSHMTLAP